jgi:RNA polymerase sigma-70 factor, ECF subfamily
MKERQILASLKDGNPDALKMIFDSHHASLCKVVYKMVKDADQAKDIVQDVFIKFWNNRNGIEIEISLEAYLKRAAYNTALNHLKSTGRWKKQELNELDLTFRATNSTELQISHDELSENVKLAVSNLPERTREVFLLIRSEEMSYKETAETMNISVKAVEKEMMKALKLLRASLKHLISVFFILTAVYC